MPYVTAVVVTHNRLAYLQGCIVALQRQTVPVNRIVVINNNSTDGTAAWLAAQTSLEVTHQPNSGSAGGFFSGIKKAYELGDEWIWVMDDDAFPEDTCLDRLLDAAILNPHFTAYAPSVWENHKICKYHTGVFEYSPGLKMMHLNLPGEAYKETDGRVTAADFGSFVGLFLRRDTVSKTGFPNPKFFLHMDDLEYCMRMSVYGKIGYVINAKIRHREKIETQTGTPETADKKFLRTLPFRSFGNRNTVYLKTRYFRQHKPLMVYWFALRLAIWYLLTAVSIIKKGPYRRLQLSLLLSALTDGLRGRLDNEKPFRIAAKYQQQQ